MADENDTMNLLENQLKDLMNSAVFNFIKDRAEGLSLPLWKIIEHYLIDRMAWEKAESEVEGPKVLLDQFKKADGKFLAGKELFDFLVEQYKSHLYDYGILKNKLADWLSAKKLESSFQNLTPEVKAKVEKIMASQEEKQKQGKKAYRESKKPE